MGETGNNGTLNVDYEESIALRQQEAADNPGLFRFGQTYGSTHVDFDKNYKATNSFSQGGAGTYRVQTGDSLQSIAGAVWGDSSQWYKIAEANGLSGASALTDGMVLRIPASVVNNTHNANTFAPYDPNAALGDVSPTTPTPQAQGEGGGKCGTFGKILLAVVAVAIQFIPVVGQIATAVGGAIGSAVGAVAGATIGGAVGSFAAGATLGAISSAGSQAVGVATGIQDKFSWKAVGTAALSGGIGGGSTGSFVNDAINGAINNATVQGIAVVTGLQKKFDFAGVAAAGIGAGVGGQVGKYLDVKPLRGENADLSIGNYAENLAVSAASTIANAATRSAIEGSNFGDNVVTAIPDVIGQAVGNLVGNNFAAKLTLRTNEAGTTNTDKTAKTVENGLDVGGAVTEAIKRGIARGRAPLGNVTQLASAGETTVSATEIMGPLEAKDIHLHAVNHDPTQYLNEYGLELYELGWLDRVNGGANSSPMVSELNKGGLRNLLRTLGASKSLSKFLTGNGVSAGNYSLTRNLVSSDPIVVNVEHQIANAVYSDDRTTLTNVSFNQNEYSVAVVLGIWNNLKGLNNSENAISNSVQLKKKVKSISSSASKFTDDKFADLDVRGFVKGIAQITNEAKLGGKGKYSQSFEKGIAIERLSDGSLAVTKLRAGGAQGLSFSGLINSNTVAILHDHHNRPLIGGGTLAQTPTPIGDSSSLHFKNIPGFMFADDGNILYEIYRKSGNYEYARVKNDLSLGKGKVF